MAESVKVRSKGNWPDLIVKPNYYRSTLGQLEKLIKRDQHLPGVPSANDVDSNGLNLGEMNRTLLRKVEELTLNLIEKDRQLDRQSRSINAQRKKLLAIERILKSHEAKVRRK